MQFHTRLSPRRFVVACMIPLAFAIGCHNKQRERQPKAAPAESESALVKETEKEQQQPPENLETPLSQESTEAPSPWQPTGKWTRQRLIVLGTSGPIVVDVSASVGELDLETVASQTYSHLAAQLLTASQTTDESSPSSTSWQQLLDHPIVRSGWLGNLVANNEQRNQLISRYDIQRDDLVSPDELPAFLSRGLTRSQALQISDAGQQPTPAGRSSPWGLADENSDSSLDNAELEALTTSMLRQDRNADGVLTRAELAEDGMAQQLATMSGPALLQTNTMIVMSGISSDSTDLELARAHRKLASDVLRHYTFLTELSREQWPGWSDAMWQAVDADASLSIDAKELLQLATIPPQVALYLRLPPTQPQPEQPQPEQDGMQSEEGARPVDGGVEVNVQTLDAGFRWTANSRGGVLTGNGCSLLIEVRDSFTEFGKGRLRENLQGALRNPQSKAILTGQLQLQDDAFTSLDADADQTLSDTEFENAWSWLSSRQGGRVSGKWMVVAEPWFQLADANADARVSERELQELSQFAVKLDADQDQLVTPSELPLVVRLELQRTDERLIALLGGTGADGEEVGELDWFSAMDSNRDGYLSPAEFLGDSSIFAASDSNRDGLLDRTEAFSWDVGSTRRGK